MENGQPAPDYYDYIIIGSGFGGSVSAMRLAEKGYSVLVLERGRRFAAEDFPRSNWNIFKFLWLPALRCFGIMGINKLDDILIFNGSGVGGGSLVYAATHIEPGQSFYEAPEWAGLADWESELAPHFAAARQMLGVNRNPKLWPADHLLRDIATELGQEETFAPTPVAIYFGEPGETVPDPYFGGEGPPRSGCIHCGGCMVGCRHNAKNTLDKNYLYFAEKHGAEVRPLANVLDIKPVPGGRRVDGARYEVVYERTSDWFWKRRYRVRARNVVVAAGVLGTNNLLLRCRDETGSLPRLSPQLGKMVRSNSEAFLGVTGRDGDVDYSEGIAITSHFWVDEVTSVEPVRYPRGSSLLRNLGVPLLAPGGTRLRRIGRLIAHGVRRPWDLLKARMLPDWARDTTILMVMQSLESRMRLKRGRSAWTLFRRGLVSERDPAWPIPAAIDAGLTVAERFAQRMNGIPQSMVNEFLLDTPTTAHILGGCGIGRDEQSGVVDANHEVFNYPGLYVADGSVIPANLGVNPSLTITAMTERAMSKIAPKAEGRARRVAPEAIRPARRRRALATAVAALAAVGAFVVARRRTHPEIGSI